MSSCSRRVTGRRYAGMGARCVQQTERPLHRAGQRRNSGPRLRGPARYVPSAGQAAAGKYDHQSLREDDEEVNFRTT